MQDGVGQAPPHPDVLVSWKVLKALDLLDFAAASSSHFGFKPFLSNGALLVRAQSVFFFLVSRQGCRAEDGAQEILRGLRPPEARWPRADGNDLKIVARMRVTALAAVGQWDPTHPILFEALQMHGPRPRFNHCRIGSRGRRCHRAREEMGVWNVARRANGEPEAKKHEEEDTMHIKPSGRQPISPVCRILMPPVWAQSRPHWRGIKPRPGKRRFAVGV